MDHPRVMYKLYCTVSAQLIWLGTNGNTVTNTSPASSYVWEVFKN